MANTIKVETSRLKAAASEFSNTSAQIKNATNTMTQTVGQLSGSVWSGDAATAYANKFNGLQDEIQKIDKMIQEHVKDLNEMAAEYERAENEATQTASSLNSEIFA
ncbi:MAG: WXG100 family type VII secretion target [Mogibacterium sp.]|nr:WXG100 family type VII secretion target [Mogibacterium sp.]